VALTLIGIVSKNTFFDNLDMSAVLCAIYEALTKKIPGSVPVESLAALKSAPKGGTPSPAASKAIAGLRFGKHWEEIGWQGEDPATDLRAAGLLG
jgi:hypothetical protein